jgi:hypothetical protein
LRVQAAGDVQLGIEVSGADHRPQSSASSAWATSHASAAIERRDRRDREYIAQRARAAGR